MLILLRPQIVFYFFMPFRKPALLLPLFLGVVPLAAQTTYEIGTVTITSGLSAQDQRETAREVNVISGTQFAQLPVHSLDELLRYVPGVEVQARGPFGAQSDIVIRGGTFQQVLVLVDGLRVNDPITGHFNSNIPIAPGEIDRIEVLKGAASALYGADAVGGVVHIITKTFSGTDTTEGEARLSGGQYGYLGAQAGGSYHRGRTIVAGGVLYNQADGVPQRGINGFAKTTTASLSLAQKLNTFWTLSARSAYDDRDFAAQNFYTTFKSDTATEQVRTFWQQVGLHYAKSRWQLRFDGSYKTLSDIYQFSPLAAANENRAALAQGLAVASVALRSGRRLTVGGQVLSGAMKSNDRGDHQLTQGGIFALYSHTISGKLIVEPALRLTFPQLGGARLIPQLNAAWIGQRYKIRGAIGTSLREPDFTERFNNYNKPVVKSGSIGNPALIAEKGLSYELGVDVQPIRNLRLSVTGFRREQQDLIDFVTTPYAQMPRQENLVSGGSYALAQNIGAVNTSGIEASGTYEKTLSNGRLRVDGGVVWLNTTGINGAPGFYISSHARFLANGSVSYQYRRLTLSATAMYKERQVQTATAIEAEVSPSYFLMNLRAEAKVNRWLAVFAQADNLTNTTYSDLLGAQMPGRWWSGGVRLWGSK
jgi:iron complex outermembrane receptor protein